MRNFVFSFRGALVLSIIVSLALGIYWGISIDSRIILQSLLFILVMNFITAARGNRNIIRIEEAAKSYGDLLPSQLKKGIRFGNILTFTIGSMLVILMVKQLLQISAHEEDIQKLSKDVQQTINRLRYNISLIIWLFVYDILFLLLYFEPKTKKLFR